MMSTEANTHACLQVLVTGAVSQLLGYILQAIAPPFPVFVLAYTFTGAASAWQV